MRGMDPTISATFRDRVTCATAIHYRFILFGHTLYLFTDKARFLLLLKLSCPFILQIEINMKLMLPSVVWFADQN